MEQTSHPFQLFKGVTEMRKSNQDNIQDGRIDGLIEDLFGALKASDVEIDTAASSPFLYRRIRVHIDQEEQRRARESNPWLALFLTARPGCARPSCWRLSSRRWLPGTCIRSLRRVSL